MNLTDTLKAALASTLLVGASAALAGDLKTYEWKGVSFQYPASWALQQADAPAETAVNLQLLSQTNPPVNLFVNLNADKSLQGRTADQSGKVGEAFCLPIALQLAQKVEERIFHMPSRIQVSGKTSRSVTILVQREADGQKSFNSLHCFAGLGPDKVALGAIIAGGVPGQIMQQKPYLDAVEQAYDIVDSIAFR